MYTLDYHAVGTAQDSSLSEQETVPENRTGTRTLIEYWTPSQAFKTCAPGYHTDDTATVSLPHPGEHCDTSSTTATSSQLSTLGENNHSDKKWSYETIVVNSYNNSSYR